MVFKKGAKGAVVVGVVAFGHIQLCESFLDPPVLSLKQIGMLKTFDNKLCLEAV